VHAFPAATDSPWEFRTEALYTTSQQPFAFKSNGRTGFQCRIRKLNRICSIDVAEMHSIAEALPVTFSITQRHNHFAHAGSGRDSSKQAITLFNQISK